MAEIKAQFQAQKSYFNSLNPMDINRRELLLRKLYSVVFEHENEILEALRTDLGKSEFEGIIAETQFILGEINHALKKLKKWSKRKSVRSPFLQFPSRSYIQPMPLGNVLIIGPWNYPFQLLLSPLVGAIAAGNTAIIKPSEVSQATSKVVAKIINSNFDPREVLVIEGAIAETTELLEQPFNHIFYTGNSTVGRIVMRKAAENLTPVTLELGGKSPCLVFDVKDIETVSSRIVWGKFFNAGQTCVAPDYIITNEELLPQLTNGIKKAIKSFYGDNIKESPDYGRIINQRHFDRLESYLSDSEVVIGEERNREECFFPPTILKSHWDALVMKDEIFGPILPILTVSNIEEAITKVKAGERPLAAYLFTDNHHHKEMYSNTVISGGMCINDTIVHLTSEMLPFGGVGESGMGAYHGKFSFDTFSHKKSVMVRGIFPDLPLRYPPYLGKVKIIRLLLKLLG